MQRISRALEILEAADVVDDRERPDVVEQRVDREVAPEGVFLGRAVGVVALNQAIARRGAAAGARFLRRRSAVGSPGADRVSRRCPALGGFRFRRQLDGIDLPAERRDLDGLGAELDVGEAEAPADDPAVAEQLLDLVRMRRRADVEVLRPAVEQQVADAAADQVGDVVVLVEPVEDLEASGSMSRREIACSDRGTMVGSTIGGDYSITIPHNITKLLR